MALQKGVCKNFGECDLADNKDIQEVEKSNFVCEECGKPLHPLENEKGGGGTGPQGPNWKLIGGAIACVAVLGGGGYGIYSALSGGDSSKQKGEPRITLNSDSLQKAKEDSILKAKEDSILKAKEDSAAKAQGNDGVEKPQPPQPPTSSIKVPFGTYSGPANGQGGTIKVTRSYSLSLNDDGEPIELSPGDEIQQTKFANGELRGGVWIHQGSRRFFTR